MTNHIHLLLTPPDADRLSKLMQDVNQVFVQFVNRHNGRSGSAWSGRFKSCLVNTDRYFLTCQRYIELNPVRAAMVEGPRFYRWSSYGVNALGMESEVVKPHPTYLALSDDTDRRQAAYRELFERPIRDEVLAQIRTSINRGWPFGDEAFRREMEGLGVPTGPVKRGRPKLVPEQGQTGVRTGSDPGFKF
jgi:putative transposase